MIDQALTIETDGVLLPKSRKGVELGYGAIPRHFSLYDYNQFVWDCNITHEMQRSLLYYAARFNWENRKACRASLLRMANDLKVGRKYLAQALQDLERYGWVTVTRGYKGLKLVTPMIGFEVPGKNWREPIAKQKQLLNDNGVDDEYPDVFF